MKIGSCGRLLVACVKKKKKKKKRDCSRHSAAGIFFSRFIALAPLAGAHYECTTNRCHMSGERAPVEFSYKMRLLYCVCSLPPQTTTTSASLPFFFVRKMENVCIARQNELDNSNNNNKTRTTETSGNKKKIKTHKMENENTFYMQKTHTRRISSASRNRNTHTYLTRGKKMVNKT